jgi:hypothetical protein
MAKRKADWSLIDAQMKSRDSQDRQGRFLSDSRLRTSFEGTFANRQALAERALDPGRGRVRRQAMSRPSPDRLRERSTPNYNEMTYSQPDLSSVGRGDTKSGYPTPAPARHVAKDPSWRGGPWTDQSNVPLRQQAAGGPSPSSEVGQFRRGQSTESAFRLADASMFDSTVTPKAAPIRDYKPRGKVTKDKNIQAFY